MNMDSAGYKAVILVIMPIILYVALLPCMPLMEPDEGRYALIPHDMNVSADYVTPHLKGVVYLEKPPLGYWATALSFKCFGENEFAARLFPALCAWGSILLVYFMGAFFHDKKTGLYSAAVMTTCLLPFVLGRINILDSSLAFFLAWAIWSGFRYFSVKGKNHRIWLYLLYTGSALAFMTKGLIGIVFPFSIVGVWLFSLGRWRDLFRMISPVGMLIFAIITVPWLYFVQKANPDFFFFFFVQEHFLRYTTTMHERSEPFYYYILILVAGTLPWWPYLPKAFLGIRKGIRLSSAGNLFTKEEDRFFLIWTGFIFLFFSASSSKLASYVAPAFPPLAVMMGHVFRSYEERSLSRAGWNIKDQLLSYPAIILQFIAFCAVALAPLAIDEYRRIGHPLWLWFAVPVGIQVLTLFVPALMKGKIASGWFLSLYFLFACYMALILFPAAHYLSPGKSSSDIVKAVGTYLPKGETLYQYKISMYGVDFTTGMRTPIVDEIGELKFGVDRLSPEERRRWFPTAQEFSREIINGKGRYCITEGMGHVDGLKKQVPAVRVLWDNGKFYMLHLTAR
ncbi:MAG: glycosyltransferase family 39 protein [Syntrophales bacterium]|nr:glycosyltransferase family 39 protein [Syntrophales bacterium]